MSGCPPEGKPYRDEAHFQNPWVPKRAARVTPTAVVPLLGSNTREQAFLCARPRRQTQREHLPRGTLMPIWSLLRKCSSC